jgi:hypothetical protein
MTRGGKTGGKNGRGGKGVRGKKEGVTNWIFFQMWLWEHNREEVQEPAIQRMMVGEQEKRLKKVWWLIHSMIYPHMYKLDERRRLKTGELLVNILFSTQEPDFSDAYKFCFDHIRQEQAIAEWIEDELLEVQRYEINRMLDWCYSQVRIHTQIKRCFEDSPFDKEDFDAISMLADWHLENFEKKVKNYFDVVIVEVLDDCRKFFQETIVQVWSHIEDCDQSIDIDNFVKTDWYSKSLRSDAHTRNTKRERKVKRKNGHHGMTKAGRRREMRSYN